MRFLCAGLLVLRLASFRHTSNGNHVIKNEIKINSQRGNSLGLCELQLFTGHTMRNNNNVNDVAIAFHGLLGCVCLNRYAVPACNVNVSSMANLFGQHNLWHFARQTVMMLDEFKSGFSAKCETDFIHSFWIITHSALCPPYGYWNPHADVAVLFE